MPIYEYQCKACGHDMEALQKMSDAPLVTCPACGQDSLKKKISAAAFRLKGSGWYETDFKSGNKKNVAGDSGGESGPSSEKPTAGKSGGEKAAGESKPASTPEKSGGDAKKAPSSGSSSSGT